MSVKTVNCLTTVKRVILELVVVVTFTDVDVLATEVFSGSVSEARSVFQMKWTFFYSKVLLV